MITANDFMFDKFGFGLIILLSKAFFFFAMLLLQQRPFCLKSMKIIGVGIILRVGPNVWILYLDFTGLHN